MWSFGGLSEWKVAFRGSWSVEESVVVLAMLSLAVLRLHDVWPERAHEFSISDLFACMTYVILTGVGYPAFVWFVHGSAAFEAGHRSKMVFTGMLVGVSGSCVYLYWKNYLKKE